MEFDASCALCSRLVAIGAGYVVRIDVFADPQVPPVTSEEIASADLESTLADVIKATQDLSEQDLQDGVHRRFEYRLCPTCHKRYLANPLGMPRRTAVGKN
jgi:hypothetical protein